MIERATAAPPTVPAWPLGRHRIGVPPGSRCQVPSLAAGPAVTAFFFVTGSLMATEGIHHLSADVEKHDDNCPSTNDVLGKVQWAIETSALLHDAAFHGLCGWSWPTVGAVTCGGPPSVVERVRASSVKVARSASPLREPEFRVLSGRPITSDSWNGAFKQPNN